MINSGDLNFSFAGLKTAVLYQTQKMSPASLRAQRCHLAASIQEAIVDTLVKKTKQALLAGVGPRQTRRSDPVRSFTLGGGVAANTLLQERIQQMLHDNFPKVVYYPTQTQYATDNAAMIAAVGAVKLWKKEKQPKIATVNPQLEIL